MNTIAIIMAVLMSPLVLYAMTTWWASGKVERKAKALEAQRQAFEQVVTDMETHIVELLARAQLPASPRCTAMAGALLLESLDLEGLGISLTDDQLVAEIRDRVIAPPNGKAEGES